MKPGDRVFVDDNGRQHEAVVSSEPEHGWVGLRGIPGRPGVVSVPVKSVSVKKSLTKKASNEEV